MKYYIRKKLTYEYILSTTLCGGNTMRSKQIRNQLEIVQGDITKLDCDCIVNAANRSLLGGGGIAEAFYGMPQKLRAETLKRLPEDLRAAPFRAGAFLQGESVVY